MTMRSNFRGSLSHHQARHPIDPGKSLDVLYDKVILGVLIVAVLIGLIVWVQ